MNKNMILVLLATSITAIGCNQRADASHSVNTEPPIQRTPSAPITMVKPPAPSLAPTDTTPPPECNGTCVDVVLGAVLPDDACPAVRDQYDALAGCMEACFQANDGNPQGQWDCADGKCAAEVDACLASEGPDENPTCDSCAEFVLGGGGPVNDLCEGELPFVTAWGECVSACETPACVQAECGEAIANCHFGAGEPPPDCATCDEVVWGPGGEPCASVQPLVDALETCLGAMCAAACAENAVSCKICAAELCGAQDQACTNNAGS
jgi:hypothetical protein